MSDTILVATIGALSGLLPAFITVVFQWFEQKSNFTKHKRTIELAQKRVNFLNKWARTKKLICTEQEFVAVKKIISEDLEVVFSGIHDAIIDVDVKIKRHERSLIQKIFLIYRPRNTYAWVVHTLFYMSLGLISLSLLDSVLMRQGLQGIMPTTGQYDLWYHVGQVLATFLLLLLPWALFWWIARKIDNKRVEE
jgi:hypothetical protein